MLNRILLLIMIPFAILIPRSIKGQTGSASQESYKPYLLSTDESQLKARGGSLKNPAGFTNTYVLIYRGPQGFAQGLPAKAAEEFSFPSVNFIFSAAARLLTDDLTEPGKMDGKWISEAELRKLHVNVRIRGLDGNKKPLVAPRHAVVPGEREPEMRSQQEAEEDTPYVIVLALMPSDSQFRAAESTVSKEMTSVDIFTRFMGPFGGMTSGVTALFKNWFRTKDTPTQVAYLSSDEEFGWSWRDSENFGIEGIHQCSAALRTRKEVKFLQVHVDFITEWRRFGAWMRAYDRIMALQSERASY
jgi:hypothetical protein